MKKYQATTTVAAAPQKIWGILVDTASFEAFAAGLKQRAESG